MKDDLTFSVFQKYSDQKWTKLIKYFQIQYFNFTFSVTVDKDCAKKSLKSKQIRLAMYRTSAIITGGLYNFYNISRGKKRFIKAFS